MQLPAWAAQQDAMVRFEWGSIGLEAVDAEYVIVVDVLRFSTAVEAAVSAGGVVFPYAWKDSSASEFARQMGAVLADGQDPSGPSLSPVRLQALQPGSRVVLPSPNGSTCATVAAAQGATVVTSCLRNSVAVAEWLTAQRPTSIAVIACGERWPDGSLRPSLEDFLGAASLIAVIEGDRSAEAAVAAAAAEATAQHLEQSVRSSASARELVQRGWGEDLDYACAVGASTIVPILVDGAFTNAADA